MVEVSTPTKWLLRLLAVGYVFLLVAWPVALLARQTFADGIGTLLETLGDEDVRAALQLTAQVAGAAVVVHRQRIVQVGGTAAPGAN